MLDRINSYLKRKRDKEYQKLVKLSRFPRYTEGVFELNDSKFSFPDTASFVFMYKEIFKEEIYRFESFNEKPNIIDCGANIGISVVYCKKRFPKATVTAFEPEKKIFEYLKSNIEANDIADVTLNNKAVWKEDTTLNFINEGADANRITLINDDADKSPTYEVQAVKLSDYINEEVDFLKLDIEGAEVEVIKEIEFKLKFVKRIFIEYHSSENSPQELDTILEILSRNNFHYYIDSPNRTRRMPFIDKTTYLSFDFFLNIFAIQKA